MADGQLTSLAAQAGLAYATGGASLAARGMPSVSGSAGASNRGSGSSTSGGLLGLSSGNAGPSSADALFGSPFDVFDSSGWNVSFGSESGIAAAVGDRGYTNSPAQSQSAADGQEAPAGGLKAAGVPRVYLLAGGLVVLVLLVAAVKGK